MEKQTKNRITRAWVGKELREQNRTELRTNAMLGALFALLFVPITVLISYCGVYRLIANLPVRVALTILSAVLFSSPLACPDRARERPVGAETAVPRKIRHSDRPRCVQNRAHDKA